MARFSFTVSGDKKVLKKLRGLPEKVQKKVLRGALRKAAKPLQARAKQLTPVGQTKQIRGNVKIRAAKRSRRNKHLVRFNVQVGAADFKGDQFYAAIVEFGSKRSGTGRKGQVRQTGQRGQHYMERAKVHSEDQVKRIARAEILDGVEREAAKA